MTGVTPGAGRNVPRREVLRGVGAAALAPAIPGAGATRPGERWSRRAGLSCRWLGTSGWWVETGKRTVLVDPYLSRFPTGLAAGRFDPATRLQVDADAIARSVGAPETVLVTHTHWDHFNDVPQIANTYGSRVIGTSTAYNLALSFGVPAGQLIPVKGGEVLDLDGLVVEVVASLHSRNSALSILFPGTHPAPPPRPVTIADLPEGDTLAFALSRPGGPSVLFFGASDFAERNLVGLRPEVAMIAVASTTATFRYLPRLLEALDRPRTVVAVHWDDFETPLANPPRTDPASRARLTTFVEQVRRVAPRTRVIVPNYLEPLDL